MTQTPYTSRRYTILRTRQDVSQEVTTLYVREGPETAIGLLLHIPYIHFQQANSSAAYGVARMRYYHQLCSIVKEHQPLDPATERLLLVHVRVTKKRDGFSIATVPEER